MKDGLLGAMSKHWCGVLKASCDLLRRRGIFIVATTVGALCAFALSSYLGVAHPYWSAMAVWIVLQPTRTLFYKRLARRLLGTLSGAVIGYVLLAGLPGRPAVMLACLSALCALTAGLGVLVRQHRSYALLLTGYTVCIVVVSGLVASGDPWTVAGSRMASAVIGVACALVAGLISIQHQDPRYLSRKLSKAAADAHLLAARLAVDGAALTDEEYECFLRQLGALQMEAEREPVGARSHKDALAWTQQLLEGALQLQADVRNRADADLATALRAVAAILAQGKVGPFPSGAAVAITNLAGSREMIDALTGFSGQAKAPLAGTASHHLWVGAIRSATRTFLCLAAVAAAWILSGWSYGGASVIAAAIFITLFSGHDNPTASSTAALRATSIGAALALIYSLAVAPNLISLLGNVAGLAPFMVLAAIAISRPETSKLGLDAVLAFLLIVQPQSSHGVSPVVAFWSAGATLLGMGVAVATYRYLFPTNPQRRADSIVRRVGKAVGISGDIPGRHNSRRIWADLITLGRLAAVSGVRLPAHFVDDLLAR